MYHPQDPALQGTLGSFTIQDVMSFLAQMRACGELKVRSKEGLLSVFWENGLVTWSESPERSTETGELLVLRGQVSEEDVEAARAEGGEGELGALLVEKGLIEEPALEELLVEKICETIYRLFLWTPVSFRFDEGSLPPEESRPIAMDVQGILLEGARRCDEWTRLPEPYRDPSTTFELVAEPKSDDMISLSLDEWRHLYLVSGRSLEEIWQTSPLGSDLEISALLFGLASARLVRPVVASAEVSRSVPVAPPDDPEAAPQPPPPVQLPPASSGLETISLDALRKAERERADRGVEEGTTHTMPPSSIRRLSLSQILIQSVGRLVRLDGELPWGDFLLGDDACTIGRAPSNDIVLPDGHVSAHHARIVREGHHFLLEDLESANGLVVAGKETRRVYLRGGEEVEVYPYRFRFELDFDISESAGRAP